MTYEVASIVVPGKGLTNSAALAVDAAVKEYDELLHFGYNPTNEDWCVYRKLPRGFVDAPYVIDGEPVIIVLGFGDRIPHPDEVNRRLYETDALRHGDRLLKEMNENNLRLKRAREEENEALTQEVAERMELAMRKEGQSPVVKVFFQKGRHR